MKKQFRLAAVFAAAMFAVAPVATLTEGTVSADASSDIMQQYTFNDSSFGSLPATVQTRGRKITAKSVKKDIASFVEKTAPQNVSNQFLGLNYKGTTGYTLKKNGKVVKSKYLKSGTYYVKTGLVYEVVAKNDQSQVSTGLAYINGKKVYAQMLTGNRSGDEIIGIVYPMSTKVVVKVKKR